VVVVGALVVVVGALVVVAGALVVVVVQGLQTGHPVPVRLLDTYTSPHKHGVQVVVGALVVVIGALVVVVGAFVVVVGVLVVVVVHVLQIGHSTPVRLLFTYDPHGHRRHVVCGALVVVVVIVPVRRKRYCWFAWATIYPMISAIMNAMCTVLMFVVV
jgi:hypothetical protein